KGVLNRGDHVITTSMEHNSVIRPLKRLEKDRIITLTVLKGDESGVISTQEIEEATLGSTRLFVFNHMSNVTGAVQPAAEIGKFCREKGIITIADCAQSAGIIPVNAEKDCLDIICAAGHKGLYGPTGTGVMIVRDSFDFKKIKPLKEGGTGSLSDSTDHPEFMPDKFESGTLNVAGIAGLAKGVAFLNSMDGGLSSVQEHKRTLQKYFIEKAEKYVPGFRSLSAKDGFGVVSFAVEEFSTSELTQRLSEEFNIMSRQGLHCAPLAHQRIGTFPEGTVRFGFSVFNTREEVDLALEALRIITKRKK
nr:aminotransferase class V-fold PLP-dependent enzyme [Clostridiales bacterium]